MSHLSDINSAYQKLNAKADKLYEFVILYHNYIYAHHTYENENFSMLEIHTLTYIEDSPGITATELAKIWHKSKSAISQVIKKLVDSGYVEKRYKENNEKSVCLYAHDYPKHYVKQQYLPDGLEGEVFYEPSDNGYEKQIGQHMKWLKE